jgi:hypothetical protein
MTDITILVPSQLVCKELINISPSGQLIVHGERIGHQLEQFI